MKKNIFLTGLLAMLALTSCKNSNNQNDSTETPIPAEKKVEVVDTAQKDGTTIKVNEQGMSIENKDGAKENNVNISRDSTSIEISRPK